MVEPGKDPLGAGYQVIQSKVAIGSGGFLGQGYLQGTQKGLAFLPARHTDFVFSVVGEEFGFVGAIIVLGLYAWLILHGFRLADPKRADKLLESLRQDVITRWKYYEQMANLDI